MRRSKMKKWFHGRFSCKDWSTVVRNITRHRFLTATVIAMALALLLAVPMTHAADAGFPKKAINFYLPYPPGGSVDLMYRPIADAVSKILGQPLVVINKPGASGSLMMSMLKTMPPDGYSIGIIGTSVFIVAAQQDISFDPVKDFTWIARLLSSDIGVVVRRDAPWKTFKELIQYAKANPGKIKYGTSNPRGVLDLAMIDVAAKEGIKWDMVPFSGGQETVTALLGKHIDCMAEGPGEYVPQVAAGEMRVLALFGEPSKRLAGVPTFQSIGYPAFLSVTGLIGPAGMPNDVTDKLESAFKKALSDPAVQKNNEQQSAPVIYQGREEFAAWAKWAQGHYADVVKKAGLAKK
jgi:tripartite-type tricarboxylate transporter receptor subunit TctC